VSSQARKAVRAELPFVELPREARATNWRASSSVLGALVAFTSVAPGPFTMVAFFCQLTRQPGADVALRH
jgi:hypothetical protein